jgi:hypothetical protein
LRAGLDTILRSLDTSTDELADLHGRWADIAGSDLAGHLELAGLQDGTLRVVADHGTWAARARFEGPAIAERANRAVGPGTVAGVVVTVRGRRS